MSGAIVVHCHPLAESFSGAMRDRAIAGLTTAHGHRPQVVEIGESPVAPPAERLAVETLVLVYPTWWSGQPAALSRWLYESVPTFGEVRRVIAISSHGSPKRTNLLEGENGKRVLRDVVLRRCAAGAQFEWIAFYNIDAAPLSKRVAFLDRVERRLSRP
jgi:NAD(P)H dehydrogenase (quinone)